LVDATKEIETEISLAAIQEHVSLLILGSSAEKHGQHSQHRAPSTDHLELLQSIHAENPSMV
jgi:hypothetical protein